MSPLLNYTTEVPAARSVQEVQGILAAHGARRVLTEYDKEGQITGISFQIELRSGEELGFRLPIRPEAVLKVLERQRMANPRLRKTWDRQQAVRIAWRIAKNWVEAQMALLETEQVTLEEVFLPYMVMPNNKSLYATMTEHNFLLPEGRG